MKKSLVVVFFLGASFVASVLWSEVVRSSSLELAFFDVGQGDAILTSVTQHTLYSYLG